MSQEFAPLRSVSWEEVWYGSQSLAGSLKLFTLEEQ